jgi:hypothetical protein
MQLPRRRPRPSQPRLLFMDPSQAELWTSLSLAQQQTCQELLSQLLQEILRDPNGAAQSQERRDAHERPTSA